MIGSRIKNVRAHIGDNSALYLSLVVVLVALIIVIKYPVYFRGDDAHYLGWASGHQTPLSAFKEFVPHDGKYRPVLLTVWWFAFKLFHLEPALYQVLVTLLFGFSLVLLFKWVELVFSRFAAALTLILYCGVFYYLLYVVFWFSDLTFMLEMLFINLSVLLLIRAVRGDQSYLWGVATYVLASGSKEPALMIVPLAVTFYVLSDWSGIEPGKRSKALVVSGVMISFGIVATILHPSIGGMESKIVEGAVGGMYSRLVDKWKFYSAYLMSGTGILIWVSSIFLGLKSVFCPADRPISGRLFYLILLASLVLSFALRSFPAPATVVLAAVLVPVILRRARVSIAAVWFLFSFLGIVFVITVKTRAYLIEATFGLAILMGVAAAEVLKALDKERRRRSSRLLRTVLPTALAIFLVMAALAGFAWKMRSKLDALSAVSDTRQNFRDIVAYVEENLNAPASPLIILDYEDYGMDYYRDILPMGDLEKAYLQKTMDLAETEEFLHVAGKDNISVHTLQWFMESSEVSAGFLLVMNDHERKFVQGLDLEIEVLHKIERSGRNVYLYKVLKNRQLQLNP